MSKIVVAARSYLGVPWRHQGRSRTGLDCAGLVVCSYSDAGFLLRDLRGYSRHPWDDGLVSALESNFNRKDENAQPGDVLLFRITRHPQHLAIATEKGMIHSHSGSPGVIEHGVDQFWSNRLVGVYRL